MGYKVLMDEKPFRTKLPQLSVSPEAPRESLNSGVEDELPAVKGGGEGYDDQTVGMTFEENLVAPVERKSPRSVLQVLKAGWMAVAVPVFLAFLQLESLLALYGFHGFLYRDMVYTYNDPARASFLTDQLMWLKFWSSALKYGVLPALTELGVGNVAVFAILPMIVHLVFFNRSSWKAKAAWWLALIATLSVFIPVAAVPYYFTQIKAMNRVTQVTGFLTAICGIVWMSPGLLGNILALVGQYGHHALMMHVLNWAGLVFLFVFAISSIVDGGRVAVRVWNDKRTVAEVPH